MGFHKKGFWIATNRNATIKVSDIIYLPFSFSMEKFIVQKRHTCNACQRDFSQAQALERHLQKQGGFCTNLPEFVKRE